MNGDLRDKVAKCNETEDFVCYTNDTVYKYLYQTERRSND